MAIDDDGNIIWCNWRKPLNASSFVRDNSFSAEWQGCSNTALQSVPSGICDRLFDPERLKLCKGSIIGGGQGTLGWGSNWWWNRGSARCHCRVLLVEP